MEDYNFQTNYFSSLKHGMYGFEGIGIDWSMHQKVILTCIQKTSSLGFFWVAPWMPGAKKIRSDLLKFSATAAVCDEMVFGYFDPTDSNIRTLLRIWKNRGGFGGGEWLVGGCKEELPLDLKNFPNNFLEYCLSHIQRIGFLLSLEEMQQSSLIVRFFDELPTLLDSVGDSRAL